MSLDAQTLAEKCAEKLWSGDTASKNLGMKILSVSPGAASIQMQIRDDMLNGHGISHGGFIFTLADSCFAFACNSRNDLMVAQHCSVNFCLPVKGGQVLTAHGKEVQRKGRSGIYDIEVVNEGGDIVASFRGLARQISGQHLEDSEL